MSSSTKYSITGNPLPNIPWEERTSNKDVIWRSKRNPVIPRNLIPYSNSIFNSAVVPFKGEFAGVFRIDHTDRAQRLHAGFSKDGLNWNINEKPIQFKCDDPEIGKFEYGYDPRVCFIDNKYIITWCNGYHGPAIGMAYTEDFKSFVQLENSLMPYNRNAVLFPEKINGKYAMFSRPSDNGHTPFGDVFLSFSPDLIHWGCHRHVMSPAGGWQSTKVGAGPVPLKTSAGWLLLYHGVLTSCNGFVYSFGASLHDLDKPWKVTARTSHYLMSPQEIYECVGDTPNVVFPCAMLCDAPSGRLTIYYGAADTVTGLAFAYVDDIIDFVKSHSMV